ncbi:WXG100 family type VII secretion target [Nocardia huaxiensis]|uniref:ESAT-6-like protein n=1 Tax=Nocardia huaxiensis TaxID=2755382 RepID=A0A7D6VA11_9NOCA|nr:WXG100 family type VII secretion target [Nocardia huaxiensis]QLY30031.1 WXG100 family type VII secretion target [Nocardia huaxiensis]UFS96373.1 WXG100 family type VII secretion target [Nocardia huaxiensis]
MAEPFRVDLTELDNITARVAGFVGFLNDSLTGIQQRTTAVQSGWSGPSAVAADDAFKQWMTGAQDVSEGIDAMRVAAAAAHQRYTEAVATNLEMLGRGGARS